MKILSVDLGSKNVGLAVCDELGISVSPAGTVPRKSNAMLVEAIIRQARRREADAIVVGHPINMDGTAGRAAKDAEKIAAMIALAGGPPVTLFDERLSSWEAENLLIEAGASRKKKRTLVHEAAAAVILRSYLEAKRQDNP
ncbi:MAG: Holliday junction resolvase RuvX [Deltaproteobacteria bacterium]|nr:Holliday junction resolvase RuvX [Deltaproteobacteria bacterium]